MNTRKLRNAWYYVERFVRREINYYLVRPTNLLLFLTYRCTSQCRSCTMWQRKVDRPEMSLEQWKGFIGMMREYPIGNVEMFGGDALLRKDVLFPLTRFIKAQGIPQVDLVTNCNLMDAETAREIVDSGMDTVYMSLDGVDDEHDRARGREGSFEKIRSSIELLKAARGAGSHCPKIVLNCTVSVLNIAGFEKILPFAAASGVDKVAFEYVGEFPLESIRQSVIGGIEPQPYFTPQETSILLNRTQALLLKSKIRNIKLQARDLHLRVSTRNIDTLTVDNLYSGILPNRKCYVCRYLVTVDPFGNIIPCPFYNNYILGNVLAAPFGSIWGNRAHLDFIRRVDDRAAEMCMRCILSVERNPTFLQSLRNAYFLYTKNGYDEQ